MWASAVHNCSQRIHKLFVSFFSSSGLARRAPPSLEARPLGPEMPDEADDLYERSAMPPARALHAIANEPRNLRLGRAQSHISFGPVTEKNVEQVDPPWPRPQ